MKVALYTRVSTGDGRQNAENQEPDLKDWCVRNNVFEYEIYTDNLSGKTRERPEFIKMLRHVSEDKIDTIVVWALDRFARSMLDFVGIMDQLRKKGVRFVSVTQGLDISDDNPQGKFYANILAAFAELERDNIRARVKAGMARAKKQGTKSGKDIGRPRKRDLMPITLKAELNLGLSISQIAKKHKVSNNTVRRRLKQYKLGPWQEPKGETHYE